MAVVYTHQRLDTNEVFYVGIGDEEKRAFSKKDRNPYWKNITNKTDYTIKILVNDATYEEAKQIEKYLIAYYGRKNLGLGTLVNMTNGGQGILGLSHSQQTKEKMSKAKKGKAPNNKGKSMSEESKQKISEAKKGKPSNRKGVILSEETKQKMRKPKNKKLTI